MCEFCVKHGAGKIWYLQAQNYSADLVSDLERRRYVQEFVNPEAIRKNLRRIERLDGAPAFVRRAAAWAVTRRMKRRHFGQVVPVEDMERILDFVTSVVRIPCLCRHVLHGRESLYCYGLSVSPEAIDVAGLAAAADGSFLAGPDRSGLDRLSREEALAAWREHEREGLCHTVWTFITPFIGAVCHCDRVDCLALRLSINHEVPILFRGEYVAEADPDRCSGCRECAAVCPFGAMGFSAEWQKATVDQRHCYGCGVCRVSCAEDAIRLIPRREVPAAARRWL